ncbi:MAG: discoidin domain-containing protein [bacterium]
MNSPTTSLRQTIKKTKFIHSTLLGLLSLSLASAADPVVTIDGKDKGRTFDGIGALSAGASSRLLIDYPEPQRSEILDYLFKPNFGAALQINKVEIGGDMNSTDGSEPSHMRTKDDENYNRGYEWWLMVESKKRNPEVKLCGLEWGAPNWINPVKNSVWTPENITFILKWVEGAKKHHNLTIDYLGGWNERAGDPAWFIQLRQSLDKAGHKEIQIVADDHFKWNVGKVMGTNPEYAAAVQILGTHYPTTIVGKETADNLSAALKTGKPLWGSEIGSAHYNNGAGRLAKLYNQGYIGSKMTAFINWSTIWSVLEGLPYSGCGLMLANTPWSGHYEVGKSIWATAHTTQFAQPGWQYLDQACGYFGGDAKNGSYVTLVSPNHKDFSLIAETIEAKSPQSATFTVGGGLSTSVLHGWKTNLRSNKTEDWFIKQADLSPKDGSFTVTIEPGYIYSLTTTTGQAKGVTSPPPSAMLALPYIEDFQQYNIGTTPKYFSDQHGTFEVAQATGGRQGKCLRQMVTTKPIYWNSDADPATLIGDPLWKNYRVSSDVLLEQPGYVDLVGRMLGSKIQNRVTGYHLRLTDKGHWSLFVVYNPKDKEKTAPSDKELASGELPAAAGIGKWHKLNLAFAGSQITASIDDAVVADKISDDTFSSGLVGLQANRWQTAQFMNFSVAPDALDANVKLTGNLAKLGAKVIACDSQAPEYKAELAIDGNQDTFWHSAWIPPTSLPHFLTIDFGKSRTLKGLTIIPRQDKASCRAADCEVYLSNDPAQWGNPVATVRLENESTAQNIDFKTPASARYLKITIKSTHTPDNPNVAIAELGIIE